MPAVDPPAARDFAHDVVRQLRDHGYEALWAGGCVRDQLLGRTPKDYDVATNATPAEIRRAVGQRTLAIGAAFGVITVLGPRNAGQIEVATFRQDATYSDGRHPDAVSFTNAEEDALRRDFTINGLFWDPLADQVIDYVGGQQDLRDGILRAIGDPNLRIHEDKLRMLRAVRFAAVFDFAIEPDTLQAVREHATEVSAVSAERISDELRKMLLHPNRRLAFELLSATGLLAAVLPECASWAADAGSAISLQTSQRLARLGVASFSVAMAILLREIAEESRDLELPRRICRRLKLSNDETATILFCLKHEGLIQGAAQASWAQVQPILSSRYATELVDYTAAAADEDPLLLESIAFCRQRLTWPAAQLDPPHFITGNDLFAAGIPKGPIYRTILQVVRDAQLLEQVADFRSALDLAVKVWKNRGSAES